MATTPPTEALSSDEVLSAGSSSTMDSGDRKDESSPPSELRAKLPVRVMYLHELDAFPNKVKQELVEECVGQANVVVPEFHTKRTLTAFVLAFALLLFIMFGAVLAAFINKSTAAGFLSLIATIAVATITFVLAGRGVTHVLLKQAVAAAEATFEKFRPNLIVASSYGAVVCFQMDKPKLPLLLLSPAQDQYYRYMHLKPYISIADYPYVIIVHGSVDNDVPLDDSIRLIETCEVGRCRLEIVDDDHKLSSLTRDDFRRWIEEAYERGRDAVFKQSEAGSKSVDPTLFEMPSV
ncbi:transmembrane protein [Cystoisospora suis]|uniref:Transmembrane protein n=1 Tax=Cystoisospora suis TaxID=483139 RepID=A0A2C6L0I5_9APIC|nr:transmembrane protein [Cystoisospora suis]